MARCDNLKFLARINERSVVLLLVKFSEIPEHNL